MGNFIDEPGTPPVFPDGFITITLDQSNLDTRHVFGSTQIEHIDLTHPSTVPGETPVPLGMVAFGGGGADLFILPADGKADSIKDYDTGDDCLDLSDWGVTDFSDLTLIEHRSGKLIVTFEDQAVALGSWNAPVAAADFTADQIIFAEPTGGLEFFDNDDAVNGWIIGSDKNEVYFLIRENLKVFGGGGADFFFVSEGGGQVTRILDFDPDDDQLGMTWFDESNPDEIEIIHLGNGKVVVRSEAHPNFPALRETVILGSEAHPIDPNADIAATLGVVFLE